MLSSTMAIDEIAQLLIGGGVNRNQVKSVVGTIRAKVGADGPRTKTEVGGPVYEFCRWIKILDRGHTPNNADGVADTLYTTSGNEQRATQQKWVTGKNKMSTRLNDAIAQLAGTVPNNQERAPDGSTAIAELVVLNPSDQEKNTLANNLGSFVQNFVGTRLAHAGNIKVKIVTIGSNGSSTKQTVEITNGLVAVKVPQTKQRDEIIIAMQLVDLLAADVDAHGREMVKADLQQVANHC